MMNFNTKQSSKLTALPLPEYYTTSESSIQLEYQRVRVLLLDVLQNAEGQVTVQLCGLLPMYFDLRLKAMLSQPLPVKEQVSGVESFYGKINRIRDGEGLEQLIESVKFSMSVAYRAMNQLVDLKFASSQEHPPAFALPLLRYESIKTFCAMVPKGEVLFDWVNSTLMIEFGMMALDAFANGKPLPSQKSLQELAAVVSNAGQTYGACARIYNLLPKRSKGMSHSFPENLSEELLAEQKALSEAGIEEWVKSLPEN